MSYINDALSKAQKEKDGRYARLSGVARAERHEPGRSRKRRRTVAAAIALCILIPAGLLLALYPRYGPSFPGGGVPPPALGVHSAALPAAAPQEAGATGKGGTAAGQEASAEARYAEALFAQLKGDFRQAERLYRQALAIDPGHVRALNNLGVLALEEQKTEQAIALFGKAIVLKRDYVDPYYNLACLYARRNEIDESLWYLKVAMAISDEVKSWAMKDADMAGIVASPAFKKIMEGQKN